jgi:hypothetical protein
VMSGVDGASQGASSVEMDGADPQLGDDARGLLHDLMRRGVSIDVPESAAPGDAAPTLGSSGTTSPGGVSAALVRLSQISAPAYQLKAGGDEAESACS